MTKIEKLTAQQERDLIAFRQKWLEIGICTDPADRPRAEAAITGMYARIDKPAPRFVWCDSPATGAMALHAMKNKDDMASLGDSLRASLWASLRDSLGASLRASLRASLWASLRASLWASLGASLGASLWASLRDSLGDSFYGQYESYWVALYLFCRDIGVKYDSHSDNDLELWSEVCQSCGWFTARDGLVIACERPAVQLLNERGVGHCDTGPAIAFRDGYRVWLLDGIAVDEQLVMRPETQTIKQINGEQNQDIRALRIERFGWPRFLRESGAKCVDERANDIEGTLEALYRTDGGEQRLVVTCPTGRLFALGVPNEISNCESAQIWLRGGHRMNVIAAT